MKALKFVGSSLDDLRDFPAEARRQAGFELDAIQRGHEPSDWKPMKDIGPGVREIRIHVLGEWRIIYVWQNFLMPSMCFTLFKRKLRKRGKQILNWHVTAIAKLEVSLIWQAFSGQNFTRHFGFVLHSPMGFDNR